MKKTKFLVMAIFTTSIAFSQTNTATGSQTDQNNMNQNNQNNTNQNSPNTSTTTSQNYQGTNPQNPNSQNNNINKNDWNNQSGQSGQGQNQNNQNNMNSQGGQNTTIGVPPQSVSSKFSSEYPNTKATWSRDHMNNYRADYMDSGSNSERAVVYDKNGNMVSRESKMGDNDYPTGINDYFTKNNMNDKSKIWMSEDKAGNKTYYTNYKNDTYWFDKDGTLKNKKTMGSGSDKQNTNSNTTGTQNNNSNTTGTHNNNSNTTGTHSNSNKSKENHSKKEKTTDKEMKKTP